VASLGEGWMTNAHPASEFAELRRRIAAYAGDYGRSFEALPCCLYTSLHIDEDREAAFRESKAWLDAYYSMSCPREAVETAVALGPPERCAERLRGFIAAGATDLLLRFTAADAKAQLQRCVLEVLPQLH
jgi:alkanesulfonate monooxygenase SsuD/methylene tetrahydromethanopterin reductase-like flavin-dependent oxidoreductase (luciferase family)